MDQLERQTAEHLFSGLEGNRDVYVCVFELEGNLASGNVIIGLSPQDTNERRSPQ